MESKSVHKWEGKQNNWSRNLLDWNWIARDRVRWRQMASISVRHFFFLLQQLYFWILVQRVEDEDIMKKWWHKENIDLCVFFLTLHKIKIV